MSKDKKRLKLACRRGLLELDLILLPFLEGHFDELSDVEKQQFEHLLSFPDPDLLSWLMGFTQPDIPELIHMVNIIRQKNDIMPELFD